MTFQVVSDCSELRALRRSRQDANDLRGIAGGRANDRPPQPALPISLPRVGLSL